MPSHPTATRGLGTRPVRGLRAVRATALVGLLTTGCLDLLGLDRDYVIAPATGADAGPDGSVVGSGGTGALASDGSPSTGATSGSGGMQQTGGFTATGGLPATDGSTIADGAVDDAGNPCATCAPDEKCCQGVCIKPSPFVGCSMEDFQCDPCPAPPSNSDPTCTGETCTYECRPGFDDTGSECIPGAGGSGGTGGGAALCDPGDCAPCIFLGPLACCRDNGDCGCSYVADAYCWPRP